MLPILLPNPGNGIGSCSVAAASLDRGALLRTYLRAQRGSVALLVGLLFSSIGLQLLSPQILRGFIDTATQGGTDAALRNAALGFIGVALVQQLVAVGATFVSENVGWTATNALRNDLLLHCLRLDQSFHKTRTPGELIERIDGDVTALATFFSQFVIQIVGNLLLLLGVLIVLWTIDWRVGLLLTIFALALLVALGQIQAYVMPAMKAARQQSAELYGFLEERLSGAEDIRASHAQAYTLRRLYDRLGAQLRAEWSARLRSTLMWAGSDFSFAIGTAAVFVLGARLFATGSLSVGTIYIVFFYTTLLMRPLERITQQLQEVQKANAGIVRVRELLAINSALPDTAAATLPRGALPVRFDRVSFSYDNPTPLESTADQPTGEQFAQPPTVLHEISFDLPAGSILGLLGRTGSGKTTLARLLLRLYDPQHGAIALGGVDLRSVALHEIRRRVGIVTQDVQLFHASVRDNLTLWDRSIADDRVLHAINELGLRPWFAALPAGLDTILTGGSSGLSAGEAQLLAFTRIFLRDPGLVILDEASSRLDPATEQVIERAIRRLLAGRTGIIIAHRLHTVFRADQIVILEDGQIIEYGPRAALQHDPNSRFAALLRTGLEAALA